MIKQLSNRDNRKQRIGNVNSVITQLWPTLDHCSINGTCCCEATAKS